MPFMAKKVSFSVNIFAIAVVPAASWQEIAEVHQGEPLVALFVEL